MANTLDVALSFPNAIDFAQNGINLSVPVDYAVVNNEVLGMNARLYLQVKDPNGIVLDLKSIGINPLVSSGSFTFTIDNFTSRGSPDTIIITAFMWLPDGTAISKTVETSYHAVTTPTPVNHIIAISTACGIQRAIMNDANFTKWKSDQGNLTSVIDKSVPNSLTWHEIAGMTNEPDNTSSVYASIKSCYTGKGTGKSSIPLGYIVIGGTIIAGVLIGLASKRKKS